MPRISVTGETLSRNEPANGIFISAKPDKIVARRNFCLGYGIKNTRMKGVTFKISTYA